ncbi:MAG: IMP dehydrogenase [Spirochaetia bacterium]
MFIKYYSYDDVLLLPDYADFSLEEITLNSPLIGPISLKTPIISAAMDTVTGSTMAIAIAKLGGCGVLHRNLSPEEQAAKVSRLKKESFSLEQYPDATTHNGQLCVGAAVAPMDYEIRVPLLMEAGVDFIAFDVAHGDSSFTLKAIEKCKKEFKILVMGGNAATADGTRRLIEAGADAVKVGVGAGSICTTRVICGIGVPQLSAVLYCAEEANKHGIPIIADGGLRYSGDLVKAFGAGAATVMLGNMLAITEESAGSNVLSNGRMFKQYRGMGSMDAIAQGGAGRYQSEHNKPIVPEGVEGLVPCEGNLADTLHQIVTGVKKGLWYCGRRSIAEINKYKNFVEISAAGLRESHAHDITNMKGAPNYQRHY